MGLVCTNMGRKRTDRVVLVASIGAALVVLVSINVRLAGDLDPGIVPIVGVAGAIVAVYAVCIGSLWVRGDDRLGKVTEPLR